MEPLLVANENRFVLYPIQYKEVWKMYKNAIASFWTVEEMDLTGDINDWQNLTEDERYFIKHILAFFASADGIVNENLANKFSMDVQHQEVRSFYAFQSAMEAIHGEAYSLLIDTLIKDEEEKLNLFKAITNIPCIIKKANWARKWISDDSFASRLVAFAAVEGIHFSGSFCAIFWLKK